MPALLLAAGLMLLLGMGCGAPEGSQPTVPVEIGLTESTPVPSAAPLPTTPAPAPTQAPDMLFDDSGNITLSKEYLSQFSAKTYSFDHTPRILIYHTHAREAFRSPETTLSPGVSPTPTPSSSAEMRSTNREENVIHLGDVLAEALTRQGFTVLHDTSDVEDPTLSTAYERSRKVMESYQKIDIYIDLHRNAANVSRAKDDVVMIGGRRAARMFFVVGTGITADSNAQELSNWKENYAFALSVTEQLQGVDQRLTKEIRVKQGGYYNQDLGLCLLAEVGHNANLMTDAEETVAYFAEALRAVCNFKQKVE